MHLLILIALRRPPPVASYNNDPEYLIVGLSSNYRLSDTSTLNFGTGNSAMASAAGAGTDNCGATVPNGKEYVLRGRTCRGATIPCRELPEGRAECDYHP